MLANDAFFIQLAVWAVFGLICAIIAHGRGRSPVAWFFIGALLSCIGLILVLVLPDLKQQEEKERRHQLETRRLREQLAKERQIADLRHNQVEQRLGVHDQALGLDTSAPAQIAGSGQAPPQLPNSTQWYYARGTERLGPVSAETIRHLLQANAVHRSTLVWTEGMPDWKALDQVDAFRGDLA
ncbi:MAG: DUF4339 domain-containing protein [Planctomycetes bacterium]|nr:DUF4339 domain-containing protein [Planctomycetota bacterium]